MNTHPDFEELFRLLEENHVDYMIVGGYAVAFHGYPRFTKDVDIFFERSPENAKRLKSALTAFGFAEDDLSDESFTNAGNIVTFGVAPSRVDLLNDIDGVQYAHAKSGVVRGTYGDVEVSFIGREDLIRNKQATSRSQDKVDAEELSRARSRTRREQP
ncbi:MAG: nucleotidyltransferase [Candidatus Hydrogenedentes bacterium]|nr:nucleotidyltransferase [Candidatus Hydrogenedentota bacterium]